MRILFSIWMVLISQLALAGSDFAREKKWADEVVPGIVEGDPVYLEMKDGHKFLSIITETRGAPMALVVIHGIGIHPDWGMVSTLRSRLAGHGYTTLSIQMPILGNEAKSEDYDPLFPEAAERIDIAVDYLKEKGYKKVAIVSHSLGSAMSHSYVLKHQDKLVAWASLGIGRNLDYAGINIPVLDMYGQNDLAPVVQSAGKRSASLKKIAHSRQVKVKGGDHFYNGHEDEMVQAVQQFLGEIKL